MNPNDLSPDGTLTLLGAALKTSGQISGSMLEYLNSLLRDVGMNPNDKRDVDAFIKAIAEELTLLKGDNRLNLKHVAKMAAFYRGKERAMKSGKPLDMIKAGYSKRPTREETTGSIGGGSDAYSLIHKGYQQKRGK